MRLLAWLTLAALLVAGCIGEPSTQDTEGENGKEEPLPDYPDLILVEPDNVMNFTESIVDAAIGYTNDLYEPTMEVSDTGVIYVTGHTILVDTTGAPVFKSEDDGKTWSQLPFAGPAAIPVMHGATPPPSDEIFVVAGDDGWLYGVDITAATFPVNMWSDDGSYHEYHNPNAYDRVQSSSNTCSAVSLNDRPWAATANGVLLMVNNPGGGPMQFSVMDVPPTLPAGIGGPVVGPEWNTCGSSGGYIPGIPDIREDGFFAIPQTNGPRLHVVTGYADDIFDVTQTHVVNVTNTGGGTSNYGQVVFDQEGTMFVGIRNNTAAFGDGATRGQIKIAVSQDNGTTYQERIFRMPKATGSMFMDASQNGPGAILTWAQAGESGGWDWYVGHLRVAHDGKAIMENVSIIVPGGPGPSAHVQGAGVGPDGRAYIVTFHGGYTPGMGTPLHVWIQQDGPVLPATQAGDESMQG